VLIRCYGNLYWFRSNGLVSTSLHLFKFVSIDTFLKHPAMVCVQESYLRRNVFSCSYPRNAYMSQHIVHYEYIVICWLYCRSFDYFRSIAELCNSTRYFFMIVINWAADDYIVTLFKTIIVLRLFPKQCNNAILTVDVPYIVYSTVGRWPSREEARILKEGRGRIKGISVEKGKSWRSQIRTDNSVWDSCWVNVLWRQEKCSYFFCRHILLLWVSNASF
jgi:hypothetical protein